MAEEKKTDIDPYIEEYLAKLANPNVLFIISRSKNKNIVVYEAKMEAGTIKASDPIDAYWLDIDPEYVQKARAKGVESDRVDLNMIERNMAYGASAAVVSEGRYRLTLVALQSKEVFMVQHDGLPRAETTISGKRAFLQRVYVHAKESWLGPKVQYVVMHGIDASTGESLMEVLNP